MRDFNWEDPFAEDKAAHERGRRRAEREARRRDRREALGDRVAETQAAQAQEPPGDPQAQPRPAPKRDQLQPELQPARAPSGGASHVPADALRVRRVLGIVAVVVAVALVYVGGKAVTDELAGGNEPAPAPAVPAKTSTLTIPEGLDRTQIAALTEKTQIRGDYEQASKSFKGFNPAKYGAEGPPSLEGFLFPATYDLPRKATADDLVERQLDAFRGNIAGIGLSYAKSKNLNVYDVLKIASMIEKEIQVPEERAKAAEVIYNRLAANNPLGIDATIRYEDHNYDQPLTESRLNEATPYNTRVVAGLPPTPIGNPGLASIKAAANPDKGDLFYYVIKPGTCGEHVFTSSKQEFDRASAAYQAALEAEGGSPTDC